MSAPEAAVRRRAWDRPYLLLVLTTLAWAGNAVAGRMAIGHISPMLLTFGRWALVLLLLAVAMRRPILDNLPALKAQWKSALWMGALGFTAFNALFYLAAHHTTAVNISILQGAMPVMVMLGALAVHRTPVRPGQAAGMAITLAGVAVIASGGELARLLQLQVNVGDLYMIVAGALYAAYTVALRGRPGASSLAFFAGLAASALVTSIPLAAIEVAAGQAVWPDARGWAILAYVAFAPSFFAQLFFMRAVELIGPGRAGLFINLVPVFGPILAVAILGEAFGLHNAVALALVLAGIALAEASARRPDRVFPESLP